jgi:hypothetical protein
MNQSWHPKDEHSTPRPKASTFRGKVIALREDVGEVKHLLHKFAYSTQVEDALNVGRQITEHIVNMVLEKERWEPGKTLFDNLVILGEKSLDDKKDKKGRKDKDDKKDSTQSLVGRRGGNPPALPGHIYSALHNLRMYGNSVIHPYEEGSVERKKVKFNDTDRQVALGQLLLAVEWYYLEYAKGPKFKELYTKLPWIQLAVELSWEVVFTAWNSARTFSLFLFAAVVLTVGILYQTGVIAELPELVHRLWSPRPPPVEVKYPVDVKTDRPAYSADEKDGKVKVLATVRPRDPETAKPTGHLVSILDGTAAGTVNLEDGTATLVFLVPEVCVKNLTIKYVPDGHYSDAASESIEITGRKEIADRYGAIEISSSRVRALAATAQREPNQLIRFNIPVNPQVNEAASDLTLLNDLQFSEPSLNAVIDNVATLRNWLIEIERVPRNNIWVVISSGVRCWSGIRKAAGDREPPNSDAVNHLRQKLAGLVFKDGRSLPIGQPEIIEPLKEAQLLAADLLLRAKAQPDGIAIVFDIGRDNIRAAQFHKPTPNTFGITHYIPGTKALALSVGAQPASLEFLQATCNKLVTTQLQEEIDRMSFEDVYLCGDAVWAMCKLVHPDSSVCVPAKDVPALEELLVPSKSESDYELLAKSPYDRGSLHSPNWLAKTEDLDADAKRTTQLRNTLPMVELRSSTVILSALNDILQQTKRNPMLRVQFVSSSEVDWLYAYLEEKVNKAS